MFYTKGPDSEESQILVFQFNTQHGSHLRYLFTNKDHSMFIAPLTPTMVTVCLSTIDIHNFFKTIKSISFNNLHQRIDSEFYFYNWISNMAKIREIFPVNMLYI